MLASTNKVCSSQQNSYDHGASAVLRRLTGLSAELSAIVKKITVDLKKTQPRTNYVLNNEISATIASVK